MFSNIFRASETLFKNCRGMRLKKDAGFLFPGGCRLNKALPNKPSRLNMYGFRTSARPISDGFYFNYIFPFVRPKKNLLYFLRLNF